MADDTVLAEALTKAGYDGPDLIQKSNAPDIKTNLRQATAEAKAAGICGVPSYRVFKQDSSGDWNHVGGIIWGQDEINVVEDLIAGWDDERSTEVAEPRKATFESAKTISRL